MKSFRCRIIAGVLCAVALSGYSQEPGAPAAKPQMPAGPLLQSAPAFSCWIIQFTYPKEPERPATPGSAPVLEYLSKRPRQITVTKTRQIVHEEIIDLGGRKTEKWFSGPVQYSKAADQSIWLQTEPLSGNRGAADLDYTPLPASGFRDLDWINAETFVGKGKTENGESLIFVPAGVARPDLSDPAKQKALLQAQHTVAFIDADSRLPVALRAAGATRIYQFKEPPTGMLNLPADLAEAIRKGNEARARLLMPAIRPY